MQDTDVLERLGRGFEDRPIPLDTTTGRGFSLNSKRFSLTSGTGTVAAYKTGPHMKVTLQSAIASFGASAKAKLANPAASGEPEDQLRAPFEQLLSDLAELCSLPKTAVTPVGESSVSDLKTRPDYAVTVHRALVGFIELKAPGKGANPRKFKDAHDKQQWEKLHSLPNLLYTDGNAFSLWQDGELVNSIVTLEGDIESAGAKLQAPPSLLGLFDRFFHWQPIPPRTPKDLARTSARLCRLLRDEVTEQLGLGSEALTSLAQDWRKLLFPDATDERFADGYAQAVTFGLLMARAKGIRLSSGFESVAHELGHTSSLIGAALRLLTDNAENQATLKTSLGTLTRVLDAVHWPTISKGNPEAWLYFYEDFLEEYTTTSFGSRPARTTRRPRSSAPWSAWWMRSCAAHALANTPAWPRPRSPWLIRPPAPAPTCSASSAGSPTPLPRMKVQVRFGKRSTPPQEAHRLRDTARAFRRRTTAHPRGDRGPHRLRTDNVSARMFVTNTLGNPTTRRDGFPACSRRSPSRGKPPTRSSARSQSPS